VLALTTQQYSYVVGAFQIRYTVMQPVCGFIVDLIGLRLGFALFAALWSATGMLHGLATGWMSLGAMRDMLGLFEAAAIPAGMKAVAEWFPDKEKSVAVGYFNAGTSLGALLAPPVRERPDPVPAGEPTADPRDSRLTPLLGHCIAAFLRRARLADLQFLDPALSCDRASYGSEADRDLRVAAVSCS